MPNRQRRGSACRARGHARADLIVAVHAPNRLSQHKGQKASGGGNHRGSTFRLLVGSPLLKAPSAACPTWGIKNGAPHDVRVLEQPFEQKVSRIIGAMPFLWLRIDDAPGAGSMRGYVER